MSSIAELPAVAATAVAIAHERAVESARADRVFDDPLAAGFLAAATSPGASAPLPLGAQVPLMRGYVALRTRCFDDELLAATADCERQAGTGEADAVEAGVRQAGVRQVVLLAAGLDTRAFRLAWPQGTRLFELDVPALLAAKEPLLRAAGAVAACDRTALAVDLAGPGWPTALTAAGFDSSAPTAWLAEGLLMYLDADENDRLLESVGALSAPGSVLLAEHVPGAGARPPESDADGHVLDAGGASWRSTLDDPLAWLDGHGWSAEAIDTRALATAVGRPLPAVLDRAAVADACAWLLRARRRR